MSIKTLAENFMWIFELIENRDQTYDVQFRLPKNKIIVASMKILFFVLVGGLLFYKFLIGEFSISVKDCLSALVIVMCGHWVYALVFDAPMRIKGSVLFLDEESFPLRVLLAVLGAIILVPSFIIHYSS